VYRRISILGFVSPLAFETVSELTMGDAHHRAIAAHPEYPTVIERLKTGNETFLDLGCCLGQEYV
jgi:hypothetical protein